VFTQRRPDTIKHNGISKYYHHPRRRCLFVFTQRGPLSCIGVVLPSSSSSSSSLTCVRVPKKKGWLQKTQLKPMYNYQAADNGKRTTLIIEQPFPHNTTKGTMKNHDDDYNSTMIVPGSMNTKIVPGSTKIEPDMILPPCPAIVYLATILGTMNRRCTSRNSTMIMPGGTRIGPPP